MTDETSRPAGPPRRPVPPPQRPAPKPHETLPDELKRRPLEKLHLAKPQMHPIQTRPKVEE